MSDESAKIERALETERLIEWFEEQPPSLKVEIAGDLCGTFLENLRKAKDQS